MDLENLNRETILQDSVFLELFDLENPVERTRIKLALENQAKLLGVKSDFDELYRAYSQADREMKTEIKRQETHVSLDNYTDFTGPYDRMFCGGWIATDSGVLCQTSGGIDSVACYHPILPVERLKNLETGEEQIKIAYKRNKTWTEIVIPKEMIASSNKIVGLSKLGISVNSENAKLLVKYLADVENLNDDYIDIQYSTSKLGWSKNETEFIPFDKSIIFDGDQRFRQLADSIQEHGSEDAWMEHIKKLRKSNRLETKVLMAASFASVLLKLTGDLPFFVDLWGETEGGKTVSLMVAASIWADPDESRYIGDFKSTEVALETKADMLNNLPMFLDDTSKTSARIRDNFEGVIYDMCSGKGKSRSNKELGVNRENHWRNAIICNGERPLSSYADQGGALNRILEVECGEHIYNDPQETAETVKKNYGFAGKRFIEIVKEVGVEKILKIRNEFQKILVKADKMQKQAISLSVVLTADKLATDYLFKDGEYISIDDAKKLLVDRKFVSDGQRCYDYLLDAIAMNPTKFDPMSIGEHWGVIENGFAIFYGYALEKVCKEGGFNKKSFLSYARKKDLIETDSDVRFTKQKKINGQNSRCIFLRLNPKVLIDNFGYIEGFGDGTSPFDD